MMKSEESWFFLIGAVATVATLVLQGTTLITDLRIVLPLGVVLVALLVWSMRLARK